MRLPPTQSLLTLLQLYGDAAVLQNARQRCPTIGSLRMALEQLQWLSGHLDGVSVSFDLADMRGYAYYSGAMFSRCTCPARLMP